MEFVEYREDMGKVDFQPGFEDELKGRTIEEQMHCFCWIESNSRHTWSYGYDDVPYKDMPDYITSYSLFKSSKGFTPVVRDGLVVGLMRTFITCDDDGNWVERQTAVLPYYGYTYDSESENNGAGYRTSYSNRNLVCLPYDHTLF